jgi:hypothetical protein
MANIAKIRYLVAGAALCAVTLVAQQAGPAGLPYERGVYYQEGTQWVALPTNVLAPYTEYTAQQFFGFGQRKAIAEFQGPHAQLRTANTRPTFYVRGFPAAEGLYLVRNSEGQDRRELRMRVSRRVQQGPEFRKEDLHEIDVKSVGDHLISVQPRTNLMPGEYALVSVLDSRFRWIKVGFDFGIATK